MTADRNNPDTLRMWAADYERRAAEYAERGMPERARICREDAQALRDEAATIEAGNAKL